MQIRTKLSLQFAMLTGAILVVFSVAVFLFSANHRKQEFTNRLSEKAINTAMLLIDVKEINNNLMRIIDSSNYSSLGDAEVVVFDYFKRSRIYVSGGPSNLHIDEALITKIMNRGQYIFSQGEREAVVLLYTNGLRRFIVIASATDIYGKTRINNLLLVLMIGLVVAMVSSIVIGMVFAKEALTPISNVVSQVSTITASNLNQRLNAGNGNDEISQLATTFNLMLDRLEKAFMIQKSFVSNASHELRTPLAAINSQIEVALMKKREPGEYETVLNSLLDDARGLTSLANNLLEIARSEQDIRSLSIKPVRLDELLLQTQSEFQVLHPENLVDTVILDETENEDQELSLYGNENLLKLIFINLIDNAMKFSSGRPVKVSLIFKSDSVHIMVEDKGIGISPEELQLIREPFYRASNAVHMHGHGIGLSLIAKIVKLHEGIMEINSQLNEGTTVSITLPYKMKNNGTD